MAKRKRTRATSKRPARKLTAAEVRKKLTYLVKTSRKIGKLTKNDPMFSGLFDIIADRFEYHLKHLPKRLP